MLNAAGAKPVIPPNESCCGHDLHFSGDPESFKVLAKKNTQAIEEAGVRKIVVSFSEGYQTLSEHYTEVVKGWNIEVIHISEFISET